MEEEAMKLELRNEFRIKHGTDYALVKKYGQVRILCQRIYKVRIADVANRCGVEVVEYFTYD